MFARDGPSKAAETRTSCFELAPEVISSLQVTSELSDNTAWQPHSSTTHKPFPSLPSHVTLKQVDCSHAVNTPDFAQQAKKKLPLFGNP
jgi:hypothetical protein